MGHGADRVDRSRRAGAGSCEIEEIRIVWRIGTHATGRHRPLGVSNFTRPVSARSTPCERNRIIGSAVPPCAHRGSRGTAGLRLRGRHHPREGPSPAIARLTVACCSRRVIARCGRSIHPSMATTGCGMHAAPTTMPPPRVVSRRLAIQSAPNIPCFSNRFIPSLFFSK